MAAVGGAWSIAVSLGLLIRIVSVDRLESMAATVLGLAALAGIIAIVWRRRFGAVVAASVLLVAALFPAVFGWVPLLYLPSLVLLVGGAMQASRARWLEEHPGSGARGR